MELNTNTNSSTSTSTRTNSTNTPRWCLKKVYIARLLFIGIVLLIAYVQYTLTINIHVINKSSKPLIRVVEPASSNSSLLMAGTDVDTGSEDSSIEIKDTDTDTDIDHYINKYKASLRAAELSTTPLPLPAKKYAILPKRVYSVIGLESSGTQFVSHMLKDALKLTTYREGSFPYTRVTNEAKAVQVQHFSLPWGSTCDQSPNPPVLDVVLPSQCTKGNPYGNLDCQKMTQELWGFSSTKVQYPPRYNLNIVTHKEAMAKWGVEQYFIIVIRDQQISRKSRNIHCHNHDLLMKEEEVGREIIIEAINKYILETPKTGKKLTKHNFDFWNAKKFQGIRRLNRSGSGSGGGSENGRNLLSSNAIPMGNNVILVSYESLMMLKDTYVRMMYEALDIDSDHMPFIKDGNAKYVS